ncbi:MAG: c-type cytochrome [Elusimicrobia bacterium]|nr:c-type cytochrome [Elusimicrobiota bacterium]
MKLNELPTCLALFLSLSMPAAAGAARGKALFEEHCSACHTIGGGDSVGPDLKGVTDRRKAGWLARIITGPDGLTAESDPEQLALVKKWGLEMPNLGISPENAGEIIEYLAAGSRPSVAAAGAGRGPGSGRPAAPALKTPDLKPAGSAANGRKLFFGAGKLAGGGPACAGCHSLSPGNLAAGGSYAASLAKVFDKLGANGIKAVLTGFPFPVKAAAFKGRPVTEGEIADLAAFLEETAKAAPEAGSGPGSAALAGLLGAVCAFLLIALVWNGRKTKGVKDEILSRQARTH